MADKTNDRVTPLGPGDPVEVDNPVTQSGGTFAERAGGKAPAAKKMENSTFAARAKANKKAVSADESDTVENKAVAKKSASKKS